MGLIFERIERGPKVKGEPQVATRTGFTGGISGKAFVVLGWFFVAGMIGWSQQLQILSAIGLGIYLLLK